MFCWLPKGKKLYTCFVDFQKVKSYTHVLLTYKRLKVMHKFCWLPTGKMLYTCFVDFQKVKGYTHVLFTSKR